jgi:hypothetical protein
MLLFTGGFTVQYYSGAHSVHKFDSPIDCFQLEIGRSFRNPKTNPQQFEDFSLSLAKAIHNSYEDYSAC